MIEIRATQPDESRAAANTVSLALLQAPPDDEAWAKLAPTWEGGDSLSAWDGDRLVGHATGYRVDTIVPGGARLATSAVSRVGVLSTHRRRGIAGDLLTRLLREARDRGQVLASLRASEAVIYWRYGFGIAGEACQVTVDAVRARPLRGPVAGGSFRLLAPDEVLATVRPIYDRVATSIGIITRPDWMWTRYFRGALDLGGDAEVVAVHTGTDGVDDGYVHYKVNWKQPENDGGEGEVIELFGASPAVELALWSYLCDIDLVLTWKAEERPIDEVVRLAVADPRAHRVKEVWDEQWVRLLDVDAALAARTYGEGDGVTIAVTDDLFPDNVGVWRIDSKGAARHELDPAGADLATDVATLGATYLGGVHWARLADVGRVEVRQPAALATADALFMSPRAPFCGSFF